MTTDPLLELCRDRPLVTPELHLPNDFYGHAALLKRYAGLPARRPLKAAVEHGVSFTGNLWDADLRTPMHLFLCAAQAHAREYERRTGGRKRALPIGPLWRYVPEPDLPCPPGRCLLAFPSHSTHRVRTEFDSKAFADQLEALGHDFDRVVVCVYWKDVLRGLHRTFQAHGFECVSAGHMYDASFLARLSAILRAATLVVTNEIGTQILMATLLRKPVWLRRTEVRYVASTEVLAVDAPDLVGHPVIGRFQQLFAEPRSEPSAEQLRAVEDLCGVEHVRSPAELRALLEEAESEYRLRTTGIRRAWHAIRRGLYRGRRLAARLRRGPTGGPPA